MEHSVETVMIALYYFAYMHACAVKETVFDRFLYFT